MLNGQRSPFPGNIIPASLFEPGGLENPRTRSLSAAHQRRTDQQLSSTPPHSQINGDQGDVKIDWNASDKDRILGRYSQSHI